MMMTTAEAGKATTAMTTVVIESDVDAADADAGRNTSKNKKGKEPRQKKSRNGGPKSARGGGDGGGGGGGDGDSSSSMAYPSDTPSPSPLHKTGSMAQRPADFKGFRSAGLIVFKMRPCGRSVGSPRFCNAFVMKFTKLTISCAEMFL